MNKPRFFSSISFVWISYETIWLKTWSMNHRLWYIKSTEKWNLEGLNRYLPKDTHQKSEGGIEVRFKKTRLLHLGNVENQNVNESSSRFIIFWVNWHKMTHCRKTAKWATADQNLKNEKNIILEYYLSNLVELVEQIETDFPLGASMCVGMIYDFLAWRD